MLNWVAGKARLNLYEDIPADRDAWDIDIYYENQLLETARPISRGKISSGSVREGAQVYFNSPAEISETNLIEWEENSWEKVGVCMDVELMPFEIKTFKVKLNKF